MPPPADLTAQPRLVGGRRASNDAFRSRRRRKDAFRSRHRRGLARGRGRANSCLFIRSSRALKAAGLG